MQAGPAHTVSAEREGSWVTSETGRPKLYWDPIFCLLLQRHICTSSSLGAKNTKFKRPWENGQLKKGGMAQERV